MQPDRLLSDTVSYDILNYEIVRNDLVTPPGWPLPGSVWFDPFSLVDFDLSNSRVWYDGNVYSLADFLTAEGGSQVGSAITIAPKVVGTELLADPGFDSGIAGQVNGGTFESVGTLSWDSVGKRLKRHIPSRDAVTVVQFRSSLPVTTVVSKAYRIAARWASAYAINLNGGNVAWNRSNSFSGKTIGTFQLDLNELKVGYGAAPQTTMYLGLHTNVSGVAQQDEYWDDESVKEVVPLVGHNYLATSGIIRGVTPAAASGNKVALQLDADDENDRIRLVWDANKHLRLIITAATTEQANLDLGVVDVSTAFEVRFSSTLNNFKANLNGAVIASDTSGAHPGVAYLRIGRSFTGETWNGTISRVILFASAMSDADLIIPTQAFAIYGDSTAHGDGSGVTLNWYTALIQGYDPDRIYYNAGVGGQNVNAMRDGLLADTAHRDWTTIIMDRPNTGETGTVVLAAYKAAVANLQTDRWLIVPPVVNSPSGLPDNSATAIGEVQAALLSDPFFTGHTFGSSQQAAYITAMNDDATRVGSGDFVHFNNAGQAIQTAAIRSFLDAQGW